jgi:hypothetical protein
MQDQRKPGYAGVFIDPMSTEHRINDIEHTLRERHPNTGKQHVFELRQN